MNIHADGSNAKEDAALLVAGVAALNPGDCISILARSKTDVEVQLSLLLADLQINRIFAIGTAETTAQRPVSKDSGPLVRVVR